MLFSTGLSPKSSCKNDSRRLIFGVFKIVFFGAYLSKWESILKAPVQKVLDHCFVFQ